MSAPKRRKSKGGGRDEERLDSVEQTQKDLVALVNELQDQVAELEARLDD